MIRNERIREYYERFISLKGELAAIASGLALGVFVGVTPTIPFQMAPVFAVPACFIARRMIAALREKKGQWVP